MYKLFATRFLKRMAPHGAPIVPNQINMQYSLRLCSFCNFHHRKILKLVKYRQVHSSTTTIKILDRSSIKKKAKSRTKKYAELLAVTNEATNNIKTEVHKVGASNLSRFINHSDVVRSDMYDIKNSIPSNISDSKCTEDNYYFPCDKENDLYDENKSDVLSEIKMVHEKMFLVNHDVSDNLSKYRKTESIIFKNNSTFHSAEKKGPHKKGDLGDIFNDVPLQQKKSVHQNKNKNKNKYMVHYAKDLLPYMQVYLSCGLLNKANNTLMKYRMYAQSNVNQYDKYIELYNVLLGAYASRRKTAKVLELYNIIKEDFVRPTPLTYVYIFTALGKETINNDRIVLLKKLSIEMNKYNISFNEVYNQCYFEKANLLKTIRILMPEFKPSRSELNTTYSCKLLNKIPINDKCESPAKGVLTLNELKDLLQVQLENESVIEMQIENIEISKVDSPDSSTSEEAIRKVEDYWKSAALTAFERNLRSLKQKEMRAHNNLMVLYPFLEVLKKEDYANAVLREIRQIARGSETYSTSLKLLYIALGKYIYKKYELQTKKKAGVVDNIVNVYSKYLEWYLHPHSMSHLTNMNNRIIWQHFEQEEEWITPPENVMCAQWPMTVIINIGKFLYNIVLNDIILQPDLLKGHDLKCSIPAFYTLFRNKGTYLTEQIKPHPFVSKLYKELHLKTLTFESYNLPMNTPPSPWTSIYTGGYLTIKTDFVRIPEYTDAPWKKLENTPVEQIFPIFDSLNQLGSIPWKINTSILDIIIKIFQDGGSSELNVPQSPSILSPPLPISKNATSKEKYEAETTMAQYKRKKSEMYSLWCDTLYKLSIANHFRNKVFWLPHSVDFRGRVYPVPPHLNHLSSDLGRSLLLFAKEKPLGPNGLDWLKLHVINLTNFKKGCPIQERIKYANENMDNILDSARNPLTGKMWWAQSEDPWQTLAGCMEIAAALEAPNVEEYLSSYPIHQDGSCNGLQHYAALGRDQIGAQSVNLYPLDTPQDVYAAVASIVEQQRQTDEKNGVQLAKVLDGFIRRKVIKQTVMTTVYGVTKYGAKHQIARQLKDTLNFPEQYVWAASTYLTELTFHSLRTMFTSAKEIQDWLTICARIISSLCCENVEWVTPLGFPIIQPYMKQRSSKSDVKSHMKPDGLKQRNAFPPNFIHSLDSTHMMLTSIYCNQANVTFVSVHDCFWTHACTAESMNRICRQQFVALHSEPILEDLAQFFEQRYRPIIDSLEDQDDSKLEIYKSFTTVPSKGTFDIEKVLSSTYFFN